MSRYSWLGQYVEQCINYAVQCRVLRWRALQTDFFPGKVKTQHEHELLEYAISQTIGLNDCKFNGLVRRIKEDRSATVLYKRQHDASRAFKYQGSYWLRHATREFKRTHENADMKRFLREVHLRYRIVDRSFMGLVRRKSGRLDKVST